MSLSTIGQPATLAQMVLEMSKKKRKMGRPKKAPAKLLNRGRFVRLSKTLDAAVEVHRMELTRQTGFTVQVSEALRDLLEAGAKAKKLIEEGGVP